MTAKIRIHVATPAFIEADADAFGKLFAHMADTEQVAVLRAMCEAMKPWPTQWDHISIALERPENHDVRDTLRNVLFPVEEAS